MRTILGEFQRMRPSGFFFREVDVKSCSGVLRKNAGNSIDVEAAHMAAASVQPGNYQPAGIKRAASRDTHAGNQLMLPRL